MKYKRKRRARRKSDPEVPDPITIGTIATVVGTASAVAGTTVGIVSSLKKPKQTQPKLLTEKQAPGESTTLKPGQRANLINTSPQGVLEPAESARQTLLGG